jgi:uncharacterized membrane protein
VGITGTFYKILLWLHVACVITGFGAVAWNSFYMAQARRRGGQAEAAVLDANAEVTRIAEILIYAVFILGILLVATSKTHGVMVWKFSQGWLSAAMALYIVDIGLYHGLIRRSQKEYRQLAGQLGGAAAPAGGGRPAQVSQLEQLQQRINVGWAGFNLVVLIILYLMVAKPGQ